MLMTLGTIGFDLSSGNCINSSGEIAPLLSMSSFLKRLANRRTSTVSKFVHSNGIVSSLPMVTTFLFMFGSPRLCLFIYVWVTTLLFVFLWLGYHVFVCLFMFVLPRLCLICLCFGFRVLVCLCFGYHAWLKFFSFFFVSKQSVTMRSKWWWCS